MCALFCVATSVSMNFYNDQNVLFKRLDELYQLVSHLTWMDVCYWSYGHYSLDGQEGRKKCQFFLFFCFYSKSTLKNDSCKKNYGPIHRDMTLQWYILTKKNCEIFYFFLATRVNRHWKNWIWLKKIMVRPLFIEIWWKLQSKKIFFQFSTHKKNCTQKNFFQFFFGFFL